MTADASATRICQRRRARRLAVWNGAVWAVGNGLASTTLVIYLANQLHAKQRFGLSVGLILASPHVAGLLRLTAPAMIDRLADRKRFCIAAFFSSAIVLLALPWVCAPGRLLSPGWSLAALIVLWCLYHLMQFLGTVALLSWLADAAPLAIRGRFLGWRERWMVAGTAVAAIDVGLFVWGFSGIHPHLPSWLPYGIAAALGAMFMVAALAPLVLMPALGSGRSLRRNEPCGAGVSPAQETAGRTPAPQSVVNRGHFLPSLLRPFRDFRFRRLLLFGSWFSFFNGVTISAQSLLPVRVLGISLLLYQSLQTVTSVGKWTVSPWAGRLADRLGNRPVMIVCQLVVASGLLFFAAAAQTHQWGWLVGAYFVWIAYAGTNVGLPNLMLKLSPGGSNTPYIAAFDAAGGLCFALSTIVGGALVDQYGARFISIAGWPLGFLTCLFIAGWFARSVGAAILYYVIEPPGRQSASGDASYNIKSLPK